MRLHVTASVALGVLMMIAGTGLMASAVVG